MRHGVASRLHDMLLPCLALPSFLALQRPFPHLAYLASSAALYRRLIWRLIGHMTFRTHAFRPHDPRPATELAYILAQ